MDKTCSVNGCERSLTKHDARGMCQAHYLRWKTNGDPGPALIKEYSSNRICAVEGCIKKAKSRGLCNGHYQRWLTKGSSGNSPLAPYTINKGGHEYSTTHMRTSKIKGAASLNQCDHCHDRQAQQWAYDHEDSDEVTAYIGESLLVFSLDPDHYIPLCIKCHRKFDMRWRREIVVDHLTQR